MAVVNGERYIGDEARTQNDGEKFNVSKIIEKFENVKIGEEQYTVVDIVNIFFQKLMDMAKSSLNTTVFKGVIITVPGHFAKPQIEAIRSAVAKTDMDVLEIIPEPIAALIPHGLHRRPGKFHVLIFDLGIHRLVLSIIFVKYGSSVLKYTARFPGLGSDPPSIQKFTSIIGDIDKVIKTANLHSTDIRHVVMVAESTEIILQPFVDDMFPKKVVYLGGNNAEVVVAGATALADEGTKLDVVIFNGKYLIFFVRSFISLAGLIKKLHVLLTVVNKKVFFPLLNSHLQ